MKVSGDLSKILEELKQPALSCPFTKYSPSGTLSGLFTGLVKPALFQNV